MRRGSWIVVSLFSIGEGESFEEVSKIARESLTIDANWIDFSCTDKTPSNLCSLVCVKPFFKI